MDMVFPAPPPVSVSLWRDTIAPKEHGSWSLAFEPIVLSLLVAPSAPGALLAAALAAGFFARRPLRIARVEQRPDRRAAALWALAGCAATALIALVGTLAQSGVEWLLWLPPMALAGGFFMYFDLRGAGREAAAEVAGAAAFALAPAAVAALGGWSPLEAVALSLLVLGRSVPSVLCVRAFLRAAKSGIRRDGPALVAASVALAVAAGLVACSLAPFFAFGVMLGFAVRAFALLVVIRPGWRARSVGILEAILGLVFVAGLALAWRG